MCNFHIFHHQVFFKAQPTLNLYKLGLQISCVWTYDEWPQLKVPLLQKSRSLAKNQQENQANLVDKSIFTHEARALSKPGLLKEYLCMCPDPNSFTLSLVQEGACPYGSMQSTCVSSAVLGDLTWCQTPGELLSLDSLSFALHLARWASCQAFTLLSPCWAISQWGSNYSDWHVVRSCVRHIYLIYK